MTYDNLALALVQESTYNIEDEINNFNKICESINILNENNILLESIDKEAIKEKIKKIFEAIGEKIEALVEKIKELIDKIKKFLLKKKIENAKNKKAFILKNDITLYTMKDLSIYYNEISKKDIELAKLYLKTANSNFKDYNANDEFIDLYNSINFEGEPEPKEQVLRKGQEVSNTFNNLNNYLEEDLRCLNTQIENNKNGIKLLRMMEKGSAITEEDKVFEDFVHKQFAVTTYCLKLATKMYNIDKDCIKTLIDNLE